MSEEIVIYGNSVGPALPKSDLRETDPKKGSYVLGREKLGDLKGLKTDKKGSLVEAINEVAGKSIQVYGAEVGQLLKVSAIDENGHPTAWKTAEVSTGWELLASVTTTEDTSAIVHTLGRPGSFSEVVVVLDAPATSTGTVWYGAPTAGDNPLSMGAFDGTHKFVKIAHFILTETDSFSFSWSGWNGSASTFFRHAKATSNSVTKMSIYFQNGNGTFKAGTVAKMYGRRIES